VVNKELKAREGCATPQYTLGYGVMLMSFSVSHSRVLRSVRAAVSKSFTVFLCSLIALQPAMVEIANAQDIIIDPSGNVSSAPSVRTGTPAPVVDIATPNSGGVSLNQYTQFNVGSQGVVLNNGTTTSNTQVAGSVTRNTNLTGNAATVIVNEVRGTNGTSLTGAVEVAGARTNVVIANPNGLTCNGCTFVNVGTGTLTTGVPVINGASVLLDVTRGSVTIGRNGLNAAATGTTNVNLIGRTVIIDGRVTAVDQIMVQGGAQSWDLTRARRAGVATGTVPAATGAYAIDGTAFGAMEAGRIQIVGTDAGLGVRTQGALQANVGGITVTSGGAATVASANGKTSVTIGSTTGDVTLERDIVSPNGTVAVTSPTAIRTTSRTGIYAFSGVTLNAGRGSATILGDVQSGAGITASADALTFGAYIAAAGTVSLTARYDLAINDTTIVADRVVVPNVGRVATLTSSALFTNYDVAVTTVTFALGRDVIVAPQASTGSSRLAVTASGDFRNNADLRGIDASQIAYAGNLINEVGGIIEATALNMTSTTRQVQNAGVLRGVDSVTLNISAFTNQTTGVVISKAVNITTSGLLTNLGTISSEGDLRLTAGTTLTNDGFLQAARAYLTGPTILSQAKADMRVSGIIVATATTAITNAGMMGSLSTITLTAPTITNNGAIIGEAGILASGTRVTNNGNLTSAMLVSLTGTTLISNLGTIASYDRVVFDSATAAENRGAIIADASFSVNGPVFSNLGATAVVRAAIGAISSARIVNSGEIFLISSFIRTQNIDLFQNDGVFATAGSIELSGRDAASRISMAATGRLLAGLAPNDAQQTLISGQTIDINFTTLVLDGTLAAGGNIAVAAPTSLTVNGRVQTQAGGLFLTAPTVALGALADVYAGGSARITATTAFTNAGNLVLAGELQLGTGAGAFTNSKLISATATRSFTLAGAFSNSGLFVTSGSTSINAASFSNTGQVQAGGNLSVTATGNILNKGTVAVTGLVALSGAVSTVDTGAFLTASRLLVSGGTFTNRGSITLNGTLFNEFTLTTSVLNYGRLFAEADVRITAPVVTTYAGSLLGSAGAIRVNTTGLTTLGGTVTGSSLAFTADALTSAANLSATNSITATVTKKATFTGESIAGGNLTVTAADIDLGGSNLATVVSLTGTATGFTRGTLYASDEVIARFGTTYQNLGRIEARNAVTVTATTITNAAAGAIAALDIDLRGNVGVTSSVSNLGLLLAARNVAMAVSSVSNGATGTVRSANLSATTTAGLANAGTVDVYGLFASVGGAFSNTGTINAKTYFGLEAASVTNSGSLIADSHLFLKATAAVSNAAAGRIEADAIDIRAASVSNLGLIQSQTIINVKDLTGSFTNGTTGLIYGDIIAVQTAGGIRNDGHIGQTGVAGARNATTVSLTAGTIFDNYKAIASRDIQIIASGAMNNRTNSTIAAVNALSIRSSAGGFANLGTVSADDAEIRLSTGFTNNGQVTARDTLLIAAGTFTNGSTDTTALVRARVLSAEAQDWMANHGTLTGVASLALSAKGLSGGSFTNPGTLNSPDIALLSSNGGVYSSGTITSALKLAVEARAIGFQHSLTVTDSVSLKSTHYAIDVNGIIRSRNIVVDAATELRANAGSFRGTNITQLVANDIIRLDAPTVTNAKLAVLAGPLKDVYVQLRTGRFGAHAETVVNNVVTGVDTSGYETVNLNVSGSVSLITNSTALNPGDINLKGSVTAAEDIYIRSGYRTNLQNISFSAGDALHLEGNNYLKQYGGLSFTAGSVVELIQGQGWFYTSEWLPATTNYDLTVFANTIIVDKDIRVINNDLIFSAYNRIAQRDSVVSARKITYSAGQEILVEFDPFDWRGAHPGATATADWWDTSSAGLRGHTLLAQNGGLILYAGRENVAGFIELVSGKIHSSSTIDIIASGYITSEPIYLENDENQRPGNVGWTFSSKYRGPLPGHALADVNITEFRPYENQIYAGGNVTIRAGGNLELIGTQITSLNGNITLQSANGAVMMAAAPGFWVYEYTKSTTRTSWFGAVRKTTTVLVNAYDDIYKRTTLEALNGTVSVSSTRAGTAAYEAIISAGTQIAADNVIVSTVGTQGNITLGTYVEQSSSTTQTKTKSSFLGITYKSNTTNTATRALLNTGVDLLADDILTISSGRNLTITGGRLQGQTVTVTAVGTLNIQAAINSVRQSTYTERQNLITITTIQQGFDRETAVLPQIISANPPVFQAANVLINGYTGASLNSQLLTVIGNRRFDNALLGLTEVADTAGAAAAAQQQTTDRLRPFNLPGSADGPGFAYIDTLINDLGATYTPIMLRDNSWYDKQVRLTPAFQALLSAAVSYFTGGAGLGIQGVFQKAAIDSLITGSIGGAITGNFDFEDILKGALLAGSSAFVSDFLTTRFNLGTGLGLSNSSPFANDIRLNFTPQAIVDRLGDRIISAGVSNVFNGQPFFSGLDNLGRTFLVTEVLAVAQFGIGELGNGQNGQWEGSLGHILLHGGAGCIAIELLDGNCASGFFAGVSQGVLAGSNLTDEQKIQLAPLIGSLAGFFWADGRAIGVTFGGTIAQSGLTNNYLTHAQWDRMNGELAACATTPGCDPKRILERYKSLSLAQDAQFTACIARNDVVCVNAILAELRELRSEEIGLFEVFQQNLVANGISLSSQTWQDIVGLDAQAINNGAIVSFDLAHLDGTYLENFDAYKSALCQGVPTQLCLSGYSRLRQEEWDRAASGLVLIGGAVVGAFILPEAVVACLASPVCRAALTAAEIADLSSCVADTDPICFAPGPGATSSNLVDEVTKAHRFTPDYVEDILRGSPFSSAEYYRYVDAKIQANLVPLSPEAYLRARSNFSGIQAQHRTAVDAANGQFGVMGLRFRTEITLVGPDGTRVRTDTVIQGTAGQVVPVPNGFVATTPNGTVVSSITLDQRGFAGIELKTGGATLTTGQNDVYALQVSGDNVIAVGNNADLFGLGGQAPGTVVILRPIP
jgi:filamentous hemagglutinin family protein